MPLPLPCWRPPKPRRPNGTATAVIKRKDFGISWNKTLDTGSLALGEEVQLTIDLELTRVVPPGK